MARPHFDLADAVYLIMLEIYKQGIEIDSFSKADVMKAAQQLLKEELAHA